MPKAIVHLEDASFILVRTYVKFDLPENGTKITVAEEYNILLFVNNALT